MDRQELLRYYDGLIGMLIFVDNQNRRSCFNEETSQAIEIIRKLIINCDEKLLEEE